MAEHGLDRLGQAGQITPILELSAWTEEYRTSFHLRDGDLARWFALIERPTAFATMSVGLEKPSVMGSMIDTRHAHGCGLESSRSVLYGDRGKSRFDGRGAETSSVQLERDRCCSDVTGDERSNGSAYPQ